MVPITEWSVWSWLTLDCVALDLSLNTLQWRHNDVTENKENIKPRHHSDVMMGAMASQITNLTIVYSTVYSGADQRNINAPRHWPLWRKFTGERWIPGTNGQ